MRDDERTVALLLVILDELMNVSHLGALGVVPIRGFSVAHHPLLPPALLRIQNDLRVNCGLPRPQHHQNDHCAHDMVRHPAAVRVNPVAQIVDLARDEIVHVPFLVVFEIVDVASHEKLRTVREYLRAQAANHEPAEIVRSDCVLRSVREEEVHVRTDIRIRIVERSRGHPPPDLHPLC